MKFHPIPQLPFLKPLGCRVYSMFASLFSFMKDNSVFFFSSNLIYFGKFTKSFMSYLKPHDSFYLNFASLFNVMRDNSSALSWLKLNMIFTKGADQRAKISGTFQLLRLISPNLYFGRLLLLKVCTISAKKSTEELCLLILKIDAKFEQKPIFCFKIDKNLVNFDPGTQKSPKFAL